jgi:superfamily II DNA/RNA helicase
MTTFTAFGFPETLLKTIAAVGFTTPTPIQAQAIPMAMKGRDVLGSAATGTGKTAAFALPMIAHLIKNPGSMALIMTPTRELATQVLSTIQPFLGAFPELKGACLIGGEGMGRQFQQLDRRPRLIVGTPGRINDHLVRGSLKLDRADFLVLDETDRMLDMGFAGQIEKIIARMAKKRQSLMFSATVSSPIAKMAAKYLNNPERVSVGDSHKPAANIKQEVIHLKDAEKYNELLAQLDKREGSIIVFVKTKHGADRMATRLCREDVAADAIHGDLQQNKRNRVIQNFRDRKFRVLVATDVAARGLDIPHIEHVINYDLPQNPEDYIHRVGRTARAGAEGEAVNLVTPADGIKWRAIVRLTDPSAKLPPEKNEQGSGKSFGKKSFGGKKHFYASDSKKKPFRGFKSRRPKSGGGARAAA